MNTKTIIDVGIFVYPRAQMSSVLGLTDLFQTANQIAGRRYSDEFTSQFAVTQWNKNEKCVGVCGNKPECPINILILPSCLNATDVEPTASDVLQWITSWHQQGALICSVCAGAFVLAETGLLNDRLATTHWALHDKFEDMFPAVNLKTEKLIIDEGDVITSGGIMSWLDLGLRLVDRYLGADVMLDLAKLFVVDLGHREQQFYSVFSPRLHHDDGPVLKVQHWLQNCFDDRVSISQMSSHAGLGERTFLRRFKSATGLSPTSYVQALRVAKSRELLELSVRTIVQIARDVGYEDPAAFHKTFRNLIGLSPGQYRRRFSVN